jgi:hypothetical protein
MYTTLMVSATRTPTTSKYAILVFLLIPFKNSFDLFDILSFHLKN